jgi:hypothetical protein
MANSCVIAQSETEPLPCVMGLTPTGCALRRLLMAS